MVPAHDGALDRRRLYHVLRNMGRAQVRAASFGAELGLNVDALLEQDALEERVLVAKHQTFISSSTVSSLQVVEVRLMDANGLLELLDVLSTALTEGGLRLSVTLLAFLRSGIDLRRRLASDWSDMVRWLGVSTRMASGRCRRRDVCCLTAIVAGNTDARLGTAQGFGEKCKRLDVPCRGYLAGSLQ